MNVLSLLSIPDARLPRAQKAAQDALAECQQIDECKDWADKAAALASYAKQSQDERLMRMATRISARAVRRAGELLAQIEPQQGRRIDVQPDAGNHTKLRQDAAREAGFSKQQQVQASRIAAVPTSDFEALVESPKPPTLTQLTQQGIKARPLVDHKGAIQRRSTAPCTSSGGPF